MSSHCNRYPGCGCDSHMGTKCSLPDGHEDLLKKEPEWDEFVDTNTGFPRVKKQENKLRKRTRYNTNHIPPKKKRK